MGLEAKPRKGTSHQKWNYPDGQGQLSRPIIIRPNDNPIPDLHIKTCLRTLGMRWDDMVQIITQEL